MSRPSTSKKMSGRTNKSGNVYINGKGIINMRKIDVVHASSNINVIDN